MGQRSQIYVRFPVKDGKILIPRYYGWNYGTRMISRARYIMEWLKKSWRFSVMACYPEQQEKLRRIMDVNFDFKDITLGSDLIKELTSEWFEGPLSSEEFNSALFNEQDNNDGQLYIDVIIEEKKGKEVMSIKYAFVDMGSDETMDGEGYLQWDEHSDTPWRENPYIKDELRFTEKNLKAISKTAKLMTPEELNEFRTYDYFKSMNLGKYLKEAV